MSAILYTLWLTPYHYHSFFTLSYTSFSSFVVSVLPTDERGKSVILYILCFSASDSGFLSSKNETELILKRQRRISGPVLTILQAKLMCSERDSQPASQPAANLRNATETQVPPLIRAVSYNATGTVLGCSKQGLPWIYRTTDGLLWRQLQKTTEDLFLFKLSVESCC